MEDKPEEHKETQGGAPEAEKPAEAPASTEPQVEPVKKEPEPSAQAEEPTSKAQQEAPAENTSAKSASSAAGDDKIIGIPRDSYGKLCYILVLVAASFGVVSHLFGLVGIYIPGGQISALIGLSGLLLAIMGIFVFNEKLKPFDVEHLKYIGILFAAFFFFYIVFANSFGWFGFVGSLLVFLVAVAQLTAFYIGYSLWKTNREPTKEAVVAEFHVLKNLAISKIKKVDDGIE